MLRDEAKGYDLVFFGYDSVSQGAGESANDLHGCLDSLHSKTSNVANATLEEYDSNLRRPAGFGYDKLVLVGHSLGACVIRSAMLSHLNGGRGQWPAATSIVLFAPAHHGAKIGRLVLACTLGIGRAAALFQAATYAAPVLKDLREDSEYLKNLKTDTVKDCAKSPQLNATRTFWAKKDKVVTNDAFASDIKPAINVPGATHTSICKPTGYYGIVRHLIEEMK